MDIFVTRDGTRFVWDSKKAASNVLKHGVSFDHAIDVFFDPLHDLLDASSEGDQRLAAIGRDRHLRVLYVVHLVREDELIRVISARHATGAERREHEELE